MLRRGLVIDARPRGPEGLMAVHHVLGRPVLAHLLDVAIPLAEGSIVIHARRDEHGRIKSLIGADARTHLVFATGPPPEGAAILRTDRFYDPNRLKRALKRGTDAEKAVIWRLDAPLGLAGAADELLRRQTYQPLGRFWALSPARRLARALSPTRVRPNHVTLASFALFVCAAALVAFAGFGFVARVATAIALALSLVLDTTDGHLARLQGTASDFGRWLDSTLDEVGDMGLHAAIAWSAFVRDSHFRWLLIGMLYAMGKHLFAVSTAHGDWVVPKNGDGRRAAGRGQRLDEPANMLSLESHPPAPIECQSPLPSPHPPIPNPQTEQPNPHPPFPNPLQRWSRLIGHADVRWHLWILLAALGRLDAALAVYALYYPARAVAGAIRKAGTHA